MKKLIVTLLTGLAASAAMADSYTYTLTVTNGQHITYSDPLPISGWLDKMEVVTDANSTQTVTLATYSGTTACDTYASKAIVNARDGVQIFRPRFIGTANTGTALSYTVVDSGIGATGLVAQVLSAAYERPLIGGNVKIAITGTANDGSAPVACTVYYEPLKK